MSKVIDLILDIADFRCLVRGGMLRVHVKVLGIKFCIVLGSAVSFANMYDAVNRAEDGKEESHLPHDKTL